MEILLGKKSGFLDRDELVERSRGCAEFLVDVGAGSGRFAYEVARDQPDFFCVALDAERRGMAETASRAARKVERGGAPNLLCAVSAAEALPEELRGMATRVTVNLPWGSLLKGLANAEGTVLQSLRDISAPNALLEVLFSYDEKYEPRAIERLGLPPLSSELVEKVLPEAYARRGVEIVDVRVLDNSAVRHIPLDWGRALARGRRREFYLFVAQLSPARSAPARAHFGEPHPLLANCERMPLREQTGRRSLLLDMARPRAARNAEEAVCFTAKGHPNLTVTHAVSLEICRSPDLSAEGDCLIGVGADFDAEEVRRLAGFRKLHVTLRSGPVQETFECGVNGLYDADDEIVFRKSAHCSPRTLGIGASKSAAQVGRLLVERLRRPGATLEVAIVPVK